MASLARRTVGAAARRMLGRTEVLAICLGNEVPADVVRWVGAAEVSSLISKLADEVRSVDAARLVTYANYPSTEYLQLDDLDFLTFNVFLERKADLRRYLTRLHVIAGDRPLVIGELGLDAAGGSPLGESAQADAIQWQLDVGLERGVAGRHHSWRAVRLQHLGKRALWPRRARRRRVAGRLGTRWSGSRGARRSGTDHGQRSRCGDACQHGTGVLHGCLRTTFGVAGLVHRSGGRPTAPVRSMARLVEALVAALPTSSRLVFASTAAGEPVPMTRRLIVNADDLGQSAGINRGIAAAADGGIVTSSSLMVRWPAAEQAATWARATPLVSVGLHVDLGEWVPAGHGWEPLYEVVATSDPSVVGDELSRQLGMFLRLIGRGPSHIDVHQHLQREEPLRSLLLHVGERLGVPVRGVAGGIGYRGSFYGQYGAGHPYPQGITLESLLVILTAWKKARPSSGATPRPMSMISLRPTAPSVPSNSPCSPTLD